MNYSEKLARWMLEDTLTRYPAFDMQNEIKELLDDQYFGTGRTNLLVSSLERFLHTYDDNTKIREAIFDKFQERIDAIYTGISEFKNIESLEDEFVELKQDILNLESEINQTNIIKILQNAGFLICNGTKESIMKAIDNYLANNEKTINDLD